MNTSLDALQTSGTEGTPLVDMSWKDIRAAWSTGEPYHAFYQRMLPRICPAENLEIPADPDNYAQIDQQVVDAHPGHILHELNREEVEPVLSASNSIKYYPVIE